MWSIPSDNEEGRAFIAILVAFLVIAILAFGLRVYSRRLSKNALEASDFMCFLAVVLDIGLLVIIWSAYSHGYGQNVAQFTPADARLFSKLFIPTGVVWIAAAVSVRASIILFCARSFPVDRFRIICWIIVAINIAGLISVILGACLICQPISYAVDKTIPDGHCGNLLAFEAYTAILTVILDVMVIVLPLPIVWKLQMRTKRKIELSIVFGMGLIIVVLTFIRIFVTIYVDPQNSTKKEAFTVLITGLEPILGVTIACLPFLPLVFKRIGQTYLFQSATSSLGSITKRRHKRDSTQTTDVLEADHSGPYQGLSDIEMDTPKDTSFSRSLAASERQGEIPKSRPRDYTKSHDRIFLHKDFSIKSERH